MEENIALLIDFENIHAGTEKEGLGRFDVGALMDRLKDKGRILISRAYGDWGRFARFKQEMLGANITMMELTSHGMQDKNRADIALVVDCLELAFTRDFVNTFVIVSGDSDFTPLVLKMRELNKKVIGVGTRGSTSRLIINACDEFIFYDTIVRGKARPDARVKSGKVPQKAGNAFALLVETLKGLLRENPTAPYASVLKTSIVRRQPDFSEEDAGFNSFTRFLEAARDAGYVTLARDPKSGAYRVDVSDDAAPEVRDAPRAERGERYDRSERSERSDRSDRGERSDGAELSDVETAAEIYYPAGSQPIVAKLAALGLSPLAAPPRLAFLEGLADAVKDRDAKRRRVTIPFVVEDLKRKLRRTAPEVTPRVMKDLFAGLIQAGLLVHPKDGTPIRNASAPFTLGKTAEQLNQKLVELWIGTLKAKGTDLSDASMLADLFYGTPERRRDIETAVAWANAPAMADADLFLEDDAPTPSAILDLDKLLVDDAPEAPAAPAATRSSFSDAGESASAKKRRRRRGRRGEREGEGEREGQGDDDGDSLFLTVEDGDRADVGDDLFTVGEASPRFEFSDDLFAVEDGGEELSISDDLFAIEEAPAAKSTLEVTDDLFAVDGEDATAETPAATATEAAPVRKPRSRAKKVTDEAAADASDTAAPARKPRSRAKKADEPSTEG
jgi:hypothetical protein